MLDNHLNTTSETAGSIYRPADRSVNHSKTITIHYLWVWLKIDHFHAKLHEFMAIILTFEMTFRVKLCNCQWLITKYFILKLNENKRKTNKEVNQNFRLHGFLITQTYHTIWIISFFFFGYLSSIPVVLKIVGTAVAQWLRCCATNRKVADSIPDGVIGIFRWHNPSDHTMALG